MLRIVRRGDRHDPRDLTVSFRFEGEFAAAFVQGQSEGLLPGETIKNMVHAAARKHGADEIESLGLALAAQVLERQPRISRVRVEITEQRWQRLEAGGKTQAQTFLAGSPEERTAIVTSNGKQMSVVAGIDQLTLMRSAGFAPGRHVDKDDGASDGLQPLFVGALSVRWYVRERRRRHSASTARPSATRSSRRSRGMRASRSSTCCMRSRTSCSPLRRDRAGHVDLSRASLSSGRSFLVRHGECGRTVRRRRRTGRRCRSDGRAERVR